MEGWGGEVKEREDSQEQLPRCDLSNLVGYVTVIGAETLRMNKFELKR